MPVEMTMAQYQNLMKSQAHDARVTATVQGDLQQGKYPEVGKPQTERFIGKLIDHDIPRTERMQRIWLFCEEALRHIELTNFPNKEAHDRVKMLIRDIMSISFWDADDYLEIRMASVFINEILAAKSLSYTDRPSERELLADNNRYYHFDDGKQAPPKESSGYLSFFNGRNR